MSGELFVKKAFNADVLRLAVSPSWTRLEPQTLAGDPAEGLSAALYDPLWMLGRQWQVGELTGEDSGTPLTVDILGTASPLQAFAPGDWTGADSAQWRPLPPDVPLAELIEAESGDGTPGLRGATMAGSVLRVTLQEAGFAAAAEAVVARCPVTAPSADAEFFGVALVLAGRGADGARAASELEAAVGLPAWLSDSVPAAGRADVGALCAKWLAWYRREVAPPPGAEVSWDGHRLEHRFRLSDGVAVLSAPEHPGDDIEWWTFDLDTSAPPVLASPIEPTPLRQRVLATPLRFPGMPASRFWEMEDAQVDLGAVGADPHDLARLLVIESALVYGGDWLVVPFDVPAGSLVRTSAVTYRTTFGETYLAHRPALAPELAPAPWRMYDVTSTGGAALGALVVPPAAAARLEGPVLEEVAFLRDEVANLVWAVEHVVEGASGDPVLVPPGQGLPAVPPPGQPGESSLHYVLATDVPDAWVPYLPTTAGYASVDLIRGAIRRYGPDDPAEGTPQHPHGVLLRGTDLSRVASAEVPREGVQLTRVPVVTRAGDGTYRAWVARRVRAGHGEGRSGLAFDGAT